MTCTAGIDVGSTYTKAAILDEAGSLLGVALALTGFRLEEAARSALERALDAAGVDAASIVCTATTGYGRSQVGFNDVQATDLTAQSWGTRWFFPATRTVLDIGGHTMKAVRIDEAGKVRSFRLNDKCAAGTGAFLEKTARYLGYGLEEIGALVAESTESVPISGVCAVFAESEVINHVSNGRPAGAIMRGAMSSLVEKSVRLMRRGQMEPEITLVGGIMRFPTMVELMRRHIGQEANVPPEPLVQFTGAIGGAVLARRRAERLAAEPVVE